MIGSLASSPKVNQTTRLAFSSTMNGCKLTQPRNLYLADQMHKTSRPSSDGEQANLICASILALFGTEKGDAHQ